MNDRFDINCAIMEKIIDEVREAKSIGISGHIRPDGDCIGSCMAMYMYLSKVMPEGTEIDVILGECSDIFNCIKDMDKIRKYPRRQPYDVFIALDCGPDRLGDAEPGYTKAKKTINIDHHLSSVASSDVNYIFPKASSTSELVYGLLTKEDMDVEIAKALYIGIIHDTGVMQYNNTSPETLRAVADLVSYGFDFNSIIDETFYQKTYIQNQIMGRALTESIVFMDGRCIVAAIDQKLQKFYGVTGKDMDGIVSQLRYTKGVEVAIFMYELESLKWKVSLRGNKDVPLNKVAEFFGGGGHARASGCTINGTFHDVVNNLSDRLAQWME